MRNVATVAAAAKNTDRTICSWYRLRPSV
jgi:hypothetical protein